MTQSIWDHWIYLRGVHEALEYITTSGLFRGYEQPVITFLWANASWVAPLVVVLSTYFLCKVVAAAPAYDRYAGQKYPGTALIMFGWLALMAYLAAGIAGGAKYERFIRLYNADSWAIPQQLPPRPGPYHPGGRVAGDIPPPPKYDMRYWVTGRRADAVLGMYNAAPPFLTALDFLILLTPGVIFAAIVFLLYGRCFVFALAYGREIKRPHLPTQIVNNALAGAPVDHRALARAMTASNAPVTADSLRDKIERERLQQLAQRLATDAAALNQKLSKEAEIARLVIGHAQKREELADMEQQLRKMGVHRHD